MFSAQISSPTATTARPMLTDIHGLLRFFSGAAPSGVVPPLGGVLADRSGHRLMVVQVRGHGKRAGRIARRSRTTLAAARNATCSLPRRRAERPEHDYPRAVFTFSRSPEAVLPFSDFSLSPRVRRRELMSPMSHEECCLRSIAAAAAT